ncbi:MAG TPA: (d)CMP kinase [Paludibacteraceae bacterium]|jgi:cytidylate kinase|nr:(d)CMP kinase [Paludibacteraceae bacterium]HPH62120.1 (d)CMP kinase [Paludibacteraceae bacterium]HQF49330.1 (d)CMP kinase [Paludibacteraceae bacterium]
MKKIIVAIDGFSSCGKSTMAKDLAKAVGYAYVDSGAMYRAVTLFCQKRGLIKNDVVDEEALKVLIKDICIEFRLNKETKKNETFLNGENVENEIRSLTVSNQVSIVSAVGFVRKAMVLQQQGYSKDRGVVMDGRDIGTVVFPDAELKIFLTASPEIRAQRRYDELKQKGQEESYEAILDNVKKRDYIDQNRAESPLRRAEDAVLLDNGNMTIDEQKQWLLDRFSETLKRVNNGN